MDTNNVLACIITPTQSMTKWVADAIDDALAQSYPYCEITVPVDESPANSERPVIDLLCDPPVKYIKQHNQGASVTRYTGIRATPGELIAFLDQDDLWMPKKLELQVRCLGEKPDVGLMHGNLRFVDKEGRRIHELAKLIGDDFYRRNLHAEARPYLRRALRYRPFNPATYWELAMGVLPARLRTALRWYAHKLSGSGTSGRDKLVG